ncbi:hypothetical protein QBC34DRAFT_455797 [Podospora aff. communis PSN243]|uniref:SCP domain-containing protein n=1 Tax=Podospora aff. communis PSN243 TaxID=3040156 RepID=A0AAV9GYI2_9PEZI|nr:hypothetical protein QBC34DRAFT_455797 [Podospora aff. communis PSN243]
MAITTKSLFAAAMAVQVVSGAPPVKSPLEGFEIFIPSWNVEVSPGHFEVLNGTVEEVMSQILEINPDFVVPEPTAEVPAESGAAPLEKRSQVWCNTYPQNSASRVRFQQGVNYLRGVSGTPHHGAGPNTCGRVSCSYNAAIYWCNNNHTPKTLSSYDAIANSAQHILNSCPDYLFLNHISGSNFEASNWVVHLMGDLC